MKRIIALSVLLAGLAWPVYAGPPRPPASNPEERGWAFSEAFHGNYDGSTSLFKLDSAVGYRHGGLSATIGLPVYFERGTPAGSTTTAGTSAGIGNAYLSLGLDHGFPSFDYSSTLTATAPTGESAKGLSTGHVTVDWNNHFEKQLSLFSPYASMGLANTVSDTSFFVRPFSSLGFVSHFEGGVNVKLVPRVTPGASFYAVVATGEQTVVSKVRQGSSSSGGNSKRVYETNSKVVTTASAVNDHGFSSWLGVNLSDAVDVEGGYSRSAAYDLNSVFFSLKYCLRSR